MSTRNPFSSFVKSSGVPGESSAGVGLGSPKNIGCGSSLLLFLALLLGVAAFLWAACYQIWLAFGILAVAVAVMLAPAIHRRVKCALCRRRRQKDCRGIPQQSAPGFTFAEIVRAVGLVFVEGIKDSFLVIVLVLWTGFKLLVTGVILFMILDGFFGFLGKNRRN